MGDKDLWKIVKPQLRSIESPEALLIIDDTVEEKPYTDESELICWHFDHTIGRSLKGINLVLKTQLGKDPKNCTDDLNFPVDLTGNRKAILGLS